MPRKVRSAPYNPELMHEEDGGLEAFELPKSVVARIAREALPSDIKLQKEVPLALVKGSTVFINYLAALSHDVATEKNNMTIAAAHVLDAVKQLGWSDGGELHRQLKKDLAAFRRANEAKKKGLPVPATEPKAPKPAAKAIPDAASSAKSVEAVTAAGSELAGGESVPDLAEPAARGERPVIAEENLYADAPDEDDDIEGVEEYVDGEEDEEMIDAGSEGLEDVDEVADVGLEDDEDDAYREGQD